jgi:hypothetical protein
MLGRGDLGEMERAVVPRYYVARSRDANRHFTVFTLDFADGQNLKKFRMKRTTVELKDKVANPRSKRECVHGTDPAIYANMIASLVEVSPRNYGFIISRSAFFANLKR